MLDCWQIDPELRPSFSECKRRLGQYLERVNATIYSDIIPEEWPLPDKKYTPNQNDDDDDSDTPPEPQSPAPLGGGCNTEGDLEIFHPSLVMENPGPTEQEISYVPARNLTENLDFKALHETELLLDDAACSVGFQGIR